MRRETDGQMLVLWFEKGAKVISRTNQKSTKGKDSSNEKAAESISKNIQ